MTELRLDPDGRDLAAVRYGTPGGTPVLALHGWLDNAASFAPLAAELPVYDWVALDFAGHGHSAHRPPHSWYPFIDFLDDIACALRELGWVRCTLVGHSMGGAVAATYAAACPAQIERLVLIESAGPIAGRVETSLELLRRGLRERAAFDPVRQRLFASADEAIAARRAAGEMSAPAARAIMLRNLIEHADGVALRSDPRLKIPSPTRHHEAMVQRWLDGIECPTLAIAADPIFPGYDLATRTERLSHIRDVTLVELPGHHHLHMDDAAAVGGAIRGFLGKAREREE